MFQRLERNRIRLINCFAVPAHTAAATTAQVDALRELRPAALIRKALPDMSRYPFRRWSGIDRSAPIVCRRAASLMSLVGHFETQEAMPHKGACWSLAPLAADTPPECVSLKSHYLRDGYTCFRWSPIDALRAAFFTTLTTVSNNRRCSDGAEPRLRNPAAGEERPRRFRPDRIPADSGRRFPKTEVRHP